MFAREAAAQSFLKSSMLAGLPSAGRKAATGMENHSQRKREKKKAGIRAAAARETKKIKEKN